jgi:uncharacterized protein (DUF427 family)
MVIEFILYSFALQIIQKNTVVKKNLFYQNRHVQVQLSGLIKAHSSAGIKLAPDDEPPVIVVPPAKVSNPTYC